MASKDNLQWPTTQQLSEHAAELTMTDGATRSYRVMVQADNSGTWAGNGMRYPTAEAAEKAARDLEIRWLAVTAWRVIPSRDEVTE